MSTISVNGDSFSSITSNDDIGFNNRQSQIVRDLDPGRYAVTVEGYGSASGKFKLDVNVSTIPPDPGQITL